MVINIKKDIKEFSLFLIVVLSLMIVILSIRHYKKDLIKISGGITENASSLKSYKVNYEQIDLIENRFYIN